MTPYPACFATRAKIRPGPWIGMLQLEKILEYYRKKDYHLSNFGGLCPLLGEGGIAAKFYHPLTSI